MNPAPAEDPAGDGRWLSQVRPVVPLGTRLNISVEFSIILQHNRFLAMNHTEEPQVLFTGDSIIQRLQESSVSKT